MSYYSVASLLQRHLEYTEEDAIQFRERYASDAEALRGALALHVNVTNEFPYKLHPLEHQMYLCMLKDAKYTMPAGVGTGTGAISTLELRIVVTRNPYYLCVAFREDFETCSKLVAALDLSIASREVAYCRLWDLLCKDPCTSRIRKSEFESIVGEAVGDMSGFPPFGRRTLASHPLRNYNVRLTAAFQMAGDRYLDMVALIRERLALENQVLLVGDWYMINEEDEEFTRLIKEQNRPIKPPN